MLAMLGPATIVVRLKMRAFPPTRHWIYFVIIPIHSRFMFSLNFQINSVWRLTTAAISSHWMCYSRSMKVLSSIVYTNSTWSSSRYSISHSLAWMLVYFIFFLFRATLCARAARSNLLNGFSFAEQHDDHTHCPTSFDTILCWPRTLRGTLAYLPCLAEFQGVHYDVTSEYADVGRVGMWCEKC